MKAPGVCKSLKTLGPGTSKAIVQLLTLTLMHSIKKVPCRLSHRPRFHLQKKVLNLNGKTSGTENERRGLQTFSVRSDADLLRVVCGRTSRARP